MVAATAKKNDDRVTDVIKQMDGVIHVCKLMIVKDLMSDVNVQSDTLGTLTVACPHVLEEAAEFKAFMKKNSQEMSRQKKILDGLILAVQKVAEPWEVASDNDHCWQETCKKGQRVAEHVESLVFTSALAKTLKASTTSQPQGGSLRTNLLNIVASFHERKELLCPKALLDDAAELLKSFGDSRKGIEELLARDPKQASSDDGPKRQKADDTAPPPKRQRTEVGSEHGDGTDSARRPGRKRGRDSMVTEQEGAEQSDNKKEGTEQSDGTASAKARAKAQVKPKKGTGTKQGDDSDDVTSAAKKAKAKAQAKKGTQQGDDAADMSPAKAKGKDKRKKSTEQGEDSAEGTAAKSRGRGRGRGKGDKTD